MSERSENSKGVSFRAKAYAFFLTATILVSYLVNKTGYYVGRHKGLYRGHEPHGWGEALTNTLEQLPLLAFLMLLVVAGVEVNKWGRTLLSRRGVSIHSLRSTLQRWFVPRYDEITLFVMSVAFVLLLLTDGAFRAQFLELVATVEDIRELIVAALFTGGLGISVFHAFATRNKTEWERICMLFFAVSLHFASSMLATEHLLESSSGHVHWIFPVWNSVSWLTLILLWRFDVVSLEIGQEDASQLQIVIAFVAALGLVFVGQYGVEYHWTTTLSMTVAVASFVAERINHFTVSRA